MLDSDMILESVTRFQYILLLVKLSNTMKSVISQGFFISSLEARETGLKGLADLIIVQICLRCDRFTSYFVLWKI